MSAPATSKVHEVWVSSEVRVQFWRNEYDVHVVVWRGGYDFPAVLEVGFLLQYPRVLRQFIKYKVDQINASW